LTLPSFAGRWFRWNAIAWLAGFLPFSFIAHGITGGHGRDLTPAQYTAHSIAMAVAAIIVAGAQRRALADYVSLSWARIPLAAAAFIAASWAGDAIPVDVDPDILVGFLVLGCVVWLGAIPLKGHPLAAAVAVLSFPLASFVIELCLVTIVSLLEFTPDLQANEWQHAIFWITVGGGSGLLGGWWSGLALSRMLPPAARPNAAQQGAAADGPPGRR
jgi:hypothetical protein